MTGTHFLASPVRFLGLGLLLIVMINWMPDAAFAPLNHATASLSGSCLTLFGGDAEVAGDMISLNGFRVRIVTECTALYGAALFCAFMFSVQASLKARLTGFLIVPAVLAIADSVRIAAITAVGALRPDLFEIFHAYVGQLVMTLLVLAAALAWHRLGAETTAAHGQLVIGALAWGSVLAIPWVSVNHWYMRCLDTLVAALFASAGVSLHFAYQHRFYYQTFNLVILVALLCAERRLSIRQRLAWGGGGALALVFGHLLMRGCNVYLTAFAWKPAITITTVLEVVGQYLLPVLFWLTALSRSGKRCGA